MDLEKLNQLADNTKIAINHFDTNKLLVSINDMLSFVKDIEKLNLDGIDYFEHPLKESIDLRKDEVEPSLSIGEVLKNAPEKEGNFIKVPKVI